MYGCRIWGQDQNGEFKKTEKLQEKTRIIKQKTNSFKTERYGRQSIVKKCTLVCNTLQKIFKKISNDEEMTP